MTSIPWIFLGAELGKEAASLAEIRADNQNISRRARKFPGLANMDPVVADQFAQAPNGSCDDGEDLLR